MSFATVQFWSKSLLRTVTINVVIPTDKRVYPGLPKPKKEPFKTMYLLHGVFGDYTDWVHNSRIQLLANDNNLCVVMPSGENKFYSDSNISGDYFGKFITEDLIEFTRDTFPFSHKREDTFIAGLSMGGFGAITNGLRHPELYGSICALSSALIKDKILNSTDENSKDLYTQTNYKTMFGLEDIKDFNGSVNDYETLADNLKYNDLKPKIYMACGTEDGLYKFNTAYRDRLIQDNFDVTWEEGKGNHNWLFWDTYIEKIIQWLNLGESVKGISSENVGVIK